MAATDPTKRFSSRVEFYLRARPKYPGALLRFFRDELHLASEDVIADIGSGTGFLTELFLANGNPVYAVEPNTEMREAGETSLSRFPNFHSINGSAEQTTLLNQSVHFITAGQAFHWFDVAAARAEFLRILVPDGIVALIWNDRRLQAPFVQDYQAIIESFQTDHDAVKARNLTATEDATLSRFFGKAGYQVRKFDNPQPLDRQGLIDRLASASYMPLPGSAEYAQVVAGVNAVFDAHQSDGKVIMPHDTIVHYGRLSEE